MLKNRIQVPILLMIVAILAIAGLFAFAANRDAHAAGGPIIGDADCSGDVTSRDAQAVLREVLGQPPLSQPAAGGLPGCTSLGDADCDVDIDTRDLQGIIRFVVGDPLKSSGPCEIGQIVPDFTEGNEVVAESPIYDDQGNFIGTLVDVVGNDPPDGYTVPQASGYDTWWAERWIKNALGQRLAWIRTYQTYYYSGTTVFLYSPIEAHGSMLGWDVSDIRMNGINYSQTRYTGWSSYSATFKLKDPFLGWTIQSQGVSVGVYCYGNGTARGWWS